MERQEVCDFFQCKHAVNVRKRKRKSLNHVPIITDAKHRTSALVEICWNIECVLVHTFTA